MSDRNTEAALAAAMTELEYLAAKAGRLHGALEMVADATSVAIARDIARNALKNAKTDEENHARATAKRPRRTRQA